MDFCIVKQKVNLFAAELVFVRAADHRFRCRLLIRTLTGARQWFGHYWFR
jgi:hypothetical protein